MGIFEVIREEQDAVKSHGDAMHVSTSSVEAQLAPPAQPYPHHVSGIPDDVCRPCSEAEREPASSGEPRYDLPTPDATMVGLTSTEADISTACRHTMAISGWNNSVIADY